MAEDSSTERKTGRVYSFENYTQTHIHCLSLSHMSMHIHARAHTHTHTHTYWSVWEALSEVLTAVVALACHQKIQLQCTHIVNTDQQQQPAMWIVMLHR